MNIASGLRLPLASAKNETYVIPTLDDWVFYQETLGFQIPVLSPNGIPMDKIYSQKVPNSRSTSPEIEKSIRLNWQKHIGNRVKDLQHLNARVGDYNGWSAAFIEGKDEPLEFNGDRLRVEGFNLVGGGLEIYLSDDSFAAHAYLRGKNLDKKFQANLYTINGLVVTSDNYLITGMRGITTAQPNRTVIPAGFVDAKRLPLSTDLEVAKNLKDGALVHLLRELEFRGKLFPENMGHAATREFGEELKMKYWAESRLSPDEVIKRGLIKTEKMKLLGMVYNSFKNKDYDCCIIMPVEARSGQIELPEESGEHFAIDFIPINQERLLQELIETSKIKDRTSGHLRGDIALLIAH